MSSLIFAMVGSFLAGLGGRDQMLVARLAESLGRSYVLLGLAVVTTVASTILAAAAGSWLAAQMSESAASMFVAIALALAAMELAWPLRPTIMNEPTRSFGAIGLVLLARQVTDGPRFLVCAIAAATASAELAGLGGAIGGVAAIAMGWAMGDALGTRLPLKAMRRGLAAAVFLLGIVIALSARGIIG